MREEAREIPDTLPDIESWVDKLNQLADEVHTQRKHTHTHTHRKPRGLRLGSGWRSGIVSKTPNMAKVFSANILLVCSPRTACLT